MRQRAALSTTLASWKAVRGGFFLFSFALDLSFSWASLLFYGFARATFCAP